MLGGVVFVCFCEGYKLNVLFFNKQSFFCLGFGNFVVVGLIFFFVNEFIGIFKIFIGLCFLMLFGNNDCYFFFKVFEGFLV